jgi:DNA-binding LacI/PurR family transcriptional regulator
MRPPVTTVAQPTHDVGALAVKQLGEQIRNGTGPPRLLLQPELIVRESTGATSKTVC